MMLMSPSRRPTDIARWILSVRPVMMMVIVTGVGGGRVQISGDGAGRTPPGQLETGNRRRQYGACTGLHVTSSWGILLLLHPDDVLTSARWPIGRSAARSRASSNTFATFTSGRAGVAAGGDSFASFALPPPAATADLCTKIEPPSFLLFLLLLFPLLLLLLPDGGTSRPWFRILGPRKARDFFVEALRIRVRRHCRALPQLVYWLEAAWIGHRLSYTPGHRHREKNLYNIDIILPFNVFLGCVD